MPAINNLLVALGRTFSLICVAVLAFINDHSFLHIAIAYTLSPLVVYLISYPITFHFHRELRPSFLLFDKTELQGLFSLGVKFFLVQIGGAILFASSNLIISNTLSPEEVTPYQISYYFFSIPLILFSIIISPLWSATTDAYTKGEWEWIRKAEKKMRKVLLYMFILLVIMVAISPFIYRVWIGNNINISTSISIGMAFYIALILFSLCYSNFLNGIGKIWLLTIITIIEAVVFIPLAYFFGKSFGLLGIIVALIAVNSMCAITNFIQFKKIYRRNATGIWNK